MLHLSGFWPLLHEEHEQIIQIRLPANNSKLTGHAGTQSPCLYCQETHQLTFWAHPQYGMIGLHECNFEIGSQGIELLDLQIFDLEVGSKTEVLNLQPGGWIQGHHNEKNWVMIYGLDCSQHRSLIAGGDSHGVIHFIDARSRKSVGTHQMHKKGNKV